MFTGLPAFAGNDESEDALTCSNAMIGLTGCLLHPLINAFSLPTVRTVLAV
jgi:hypothetical protein